MRQLRNSFIAGGIAFAVTLFVTASGTNAAVVRARRAAPPTPQFTVYSGGKSFGQFEAPLGATAGPDGNVWFTSNGPLEHPGATSGVIKITPQGQATYYSTGEPDMSYPFGIVTGGDGNLWFTDIGNQAIFHITPNGQDFGGLQAGLSAGDVPAGLTVAPDGSLYFVSSPIYPGPPYVGHVTMDGTITEIAHLRSNLRADPSITFSAGKLYFTARNFDTGDEFLVTLAPGGKPSFVRTGLKVSDSPCCVFETPQSIATASDGSIWFTNVEYVDHKGYHPIGHLTVDGLHFYNTPIPWPGSIAPGPDGDMWIAGQNPLFQQGMLGVIGPKGLSRAFSLPNAMWAFTITAGPDGNLWMSGSNTSKTAIIKATP